MKFSYIAINNEYQKVTGLITAEDVDGAKEELHKMGLSVLEISKDESPEFQPIDEGIQSFWFFVRDTKGKEASGTIDAPDRKNAYRRLVSEYNFSVLGLCPASVPQEKRQEEGSVGLKELEEEVLFEFGIEAPHRDVMQSEREEVVKLTNENFLEQRKRIQDEVDTVSQKAEEILEKYKEKIMPEEYRTIRRNKDILIRMKLSTNLSYIQQLSEDLFESIHSVILKYEGRMIEDEGISDTEDDQVVEGVQKEALENTSTLGQLQHISRRLNTLLKKRQFAAKRQKEKRKEEDRLKKKIQKTSHFKYMIISFQKFLFSKSSVMRKQRWQEFMNYFSLWKRSKKEVEEQKIDEQIEKEAEELQQQLSGKMTMGFVLQEMRIFIGWLLGFFTMLFFVGAFTVEKGLAPLLPFVKNLFATPFLVDCAAFLFLFSVTLSLWNHFLRRRGILFALTSFVSIGLFLLYIFNF